MICFMCFVLDRKCPTRSAWQSRPRSSSPFTAQLRQSTCRRQHGNAVLQSVAVLQSMLNDLNATSSSQVEPPSGCVKWMAKGCHGHEECAWKMSSTHGERERLCRLCRCMTPADSSIGFIVRIISLHLMSLVDVDMEAALKDLKVWLWSRYLQLQIFLPLGTHDGTPKEMPERMKFRWQEEGMPKGNMACAKVYLSCLG